jgi:hypothetical protein
MPRSKLPRRARPIYAARDTNVATAHTEGHFSAPSTRAARNSRSRKTAAAALVESGHPPAPTAITVAEVTVANMLREFEDARLLALRKEQASAAVAASMAKARLSGLFKEKPARLPQFAAKFDGNYTEAARRIALLLRLAANETASGPKR